MTPKEIEQLQAALQAQHDALQEEGDVAFETEAAGDDTARKVDEDAAPLAEMNQVIASRRNLERRKRMAAISDALERLGEDPESFGECERCSDAIPRKRLELMPWATHCVRCQEQQEREASTGRRKHITDYR